MGDKKIYWSGVEYSYEENKDLKGGFVYVFIKAIDVRDALNLLLNGLKQENLIPLEIEFISPYSQDMEWENKKQTKHYSKLYNEALNTDIIIFDDFYAYEKD